MQRLAHNREEQEGPNQGRWARTFAALGLVPRGGRALSQALGPEVFRGFRSFRDSGERGCFRNFRPNLVAKALSQQ